MHNMYYKPATLQAAAVSVTLLRSSRSRAPAQPNRVSVARATVSLPDSERVRRMWDCGGNFIYSIFKKHIFF